MNINLTETKIIFYLIYNKSEKIDTIKEVMRGRLKSFKRQMVNWLCLNGLDNLDTNKRYWFENN